MPINPDELNRIADQAYETSIALEEAETNARNAGQTALADECSDIRGRLDEAMRRFWKANKDVLLDPQEMAGISGDLAAAAASARQAAAKLAGLANALNRISAVISRILNVIKLVKAF
jgi:hypothetical protein